MAWQVFCIPSCTGNKKKKKTKRQKEIQERKVQHVTNQNKKYLTAEEKKKKDQNLSDTLLFDASSEAYKSIPTTAKGIN